MLSNGTQDKADVILWNIGPRGALAHLRFVLVEKKTGAIIMPGGLATMVAKEPRIHLPEYGSSASTIGGNRSGSVATRELMAILGLTERLST